jgi:uncharacterized protein
MTETDGAKGAAVGPGRTHLTVPSLGWHVKGSIWVADRRAQQYLLVNQESGAWAAADYAGIALLQLESNADALPLPLKRLLDPPRPVAAPRRDWLTLIYKLTDKCNYRCTYCYDRSVARPKNAQRRNTAIRQMLDRTLPERPVSLLFHGGEPMLEFDEIRELVIAYRRYSPHRLRFSLQTNLSHMTQAKLDFLVEHNIGISVSLDGHDPDLNRLRMAEQRPDPYQLLKRKLEILRGLRADGMGLLVTVGQHNVERLCDALLAFQDDGFRSVSFSFMQDVGEGADCASPGALTAAIVAITRAIADGKIDALGCMTLIQWIMRIIRGRSGYVCLGSPCGAGRSVSTVLADGDVGPCDSIFSKDFFHQDVDHYAWALEADPHMRALLDRNVRSLPSCSTCDVRAHCNGTCPGSAVLENSGIQSVDSRECAFYYDMIRELLWILCEAGPGARVVDYCERHLTKRQANGS